MESYYHGECVAVGMIPMCSPSVRERLIPVLEELGLPTEVSADAEVIAEAVRHDKKAAGDSITVIYVPSVGDFEMKKCSFEELTKTVRECFKK